MWEKLPPASPFRLNFEILIIINPYTLFNFGYFMFRQNMDSLKKMTQGVIPDRWRLFFKMFCFISPHNVPGDSIESAFMYEQVS